ncbi:pyocin activator PrtN family protein [Halomonas cupida]|uniref:pyocin activator PrtN family protein n=1 Tax=Halomonas cupida TaxID=44933 RepID=UPI003EF983E1
MNTYFGLLAEFDGRSELPLDEVAPRYFGISPRTASIRAGAQALPVPTYRAGDSQPPPGWSVQWTLPGTWISNGLRHISSGNRSMGSLLILAVCHALGRYARLLTLIISLRGSVQDRNSIG